ncbi:DMT family transporter [Pseudovibrio exalbescens]|uniref:DMT family transporter n=1 Tax=Pseudovibrio exalbescens TaxID=197461 RepID=UPI0023666E32|nr:DMT family transporter [Pseudovibrio exalbescens]MDD7910390.1 DMT family transporter [Pseudovibrio exalbescens]
MLDENPQDGFTNIASSALQKRLYHRWNALPGNLKGIFWALIATLLFAIMAALVKALGERLHVTQVLTIRQGIMALISAPAIFSGLPGSLKTKAPLLHGARTILASCAMFFGFSAVIELPLADSTVLGFARTFFMTLFAIVLLKEIVGVHRWAATIIGFVGVLIIVQPTGEAGLNIYSLMAVLASACAALVAIIVRKVSQVDQPITILTYQAVLVGLIMLPFCIYFWQTPNLTECMLLAALGAVSWAAQMSNIRALRAGEATVIAPFDYTRIVYATVISVIFFGVWPEMTTYIGAAIIISASLYTMHRESVRGRRVQQPVADKVT